MLENFTSFDTFIFEFAKPLYKLILRLLLVMLNNFSDKALLVDSDEQNAFRVLYDRYWESLYKKALQHLRCDEDAKDAVQEIFISLWRNKNTIDATNNLSAYLFAALKYHIIKQVYRKAKKGICLPLSLKQLELTSLAADEVTEAKEMQNIIAAEVSALPKRMQQVYQLSRTEYLNTSQIAKQLDISEQTVKNTLTIALKRLKKKLIHG